MDPAKMEEPLALLKPEEISDGLWMIGVFENWGSIGAEKADEWRPRILARQRFRELPDDPADSSILDK